MKPLTAPAPTKRPRTDAQRERVVKAAVDAVYGRYCSTSIAELEAAVVDLNGVPIEDEDNDD